MITPAAAETRKGVLFALACYGSWALFPVFWRLMRAIAPPDVLAYRIVWTTLMAVGLIAARRRRGEFWAVLYNRRALPVLMATTLLIGSNWLVFIWAVNTGHVLESSMGYFLNPLFNVALGVLVLRERLRPAQWAAVALAASGVLYLGVVGGHPPWAALFMAVTFAVYGLLRKRLLIPPLVGLAVETGLLMPVALVWLGWQVGVNGSPIMGGRWDVALALAAAGPVTALPLIWFAAAATRLRYSTLGFLQYLAPTGHFLLAVLAYGESVDPDHMLAFAAIWAAIAVYVADGWLRVRHGRPDTA